ncbi:unnamed protein product [Alopecurus aequalis]
MALAPRSSLRPLLLLMSNGKPRLGSFFSSSAPRSGNCTPAAPAVEPPAAPALPDISSHKRPPHEELPIHPLPDPPKKGSAVIKKSSPFTLKNGKHPVHLSCTVHEDPKQQIPDYDSCSSTVEPVSYSANPGRKNSEGVDHPLPDPPKKKGNAALGKPSPSTPERPVPLLCTVEEDPKQSTPDGGSYSSTPEPIPGSNKPRLKPTKFENITDPVHDPPQHKPPPI